MAAGVLPCSSHALAGLRGNLVRVAAHFRTGRAGTTRDVAVMVSAHFRVGMPTATARQNGSCIRPSGKLTGCDNLTFMLAVPPFAACNCRCAPVTIQGDCATTPSARIIIIFIMMVISGAPSILVLGW